MMRRFITGGVAALALALAACGGKASQADCEKACWRYAELMFWKGAEGAAGFAELTDEQKAEARKLIEEQWQKSRDSELGPVVGQCSKACVEDANSKKIVACVLEAKTAADAEKCM